MDTGEQVWVETVVQQGCCDFGYHWCPDLMECVVDDTKEGAECCDTDDEYMCYKFDPVCTPVTIPCCTTKECSEYGKDECCEDIEWNGNFDKDGDCDCCTQIFMDSTITECATALAHISH